VTSNASEWAPTGQPGQPGSSSVDPPGLARSAWPTGPARIPPQSEPAGAEALDPVTQEHTQLGSAAASTPSPAGALQSAPWPPAQPVTQQHPAVNLAPQFVPPPPPISTTPGRNRLGWLVLAGCLALAVAAAAFVTVKLAWPGGGATQAAASGSHLPSDGASGTSADEHPVGPMAGSASSTPGSSVPAAILKPGSRLTAGQSIRSPDGRYMLMLQTDGNLVLSDDAKRPQWSSQTYDNPGAYANFDGNGDLVVYGKRGNPLWHTATGGQGALLAVQDDGNAVLYRADHTGVWSSQAERMRLYPGQSLLAPQQRRSGDGRFTLVQYPDGNLVVVNADNHAIWSSQTSGHPGASTKMQTDGNLVVYGTDQKALWSSATSGNPGASAQVNADGNVVILASNGKALWGTATDGVSKLTTSQRLDSGQSRAAPHGAYALHQQPDGNLVLRGSGGNVVWSSGTYGHAGAYTKMQADGNLVVYDPMGTALWSTRTTGKGATYLLVQDDGSAVLYTAAKQPVWTSRTS
jgi:hypothetical protein